MRFNAFFNEFKSEYWSTMRFIAFINVFIYKSFNLSILIICIIIIYI